jgi:hypothetical protein
MSRSNPKAAPRGIHLTGGLQASDLSALQRPEGAAGPEDTSAPPLGSLLKPVNCAYVRSNTVGLVSSVAERSGWTDANSA